RNGPAAGQAGSGEDGVISSDPDRCCGNCPPRRRAGNLVFDGGTSMEHAAWIARCLGRAEWGPLASGDVAALAARLREDPYPAGTALFRPGQAPRRVHIVHSGAVELSRRLKDRKVVLQIVRSGDVVGDVPVFLRVT